MITTFLWMLYLVFTINLSRIVIIGSIDSIYKQETESNLETFQAILVAILWSIWYFYYLN